MTTSSDELVGKLSAMTIVGDEHQEHVDVNVRSTIGCNNIPDKDCQSYIQPTNVVGSRDRTTGNAYERIKNATVEYLKTIELSDEQSFIQDLLRFFDGDIEHVVQKNFRGAVARMLLWKVAEECYKEAISPSGILNAGRYFNDFKNSQPRQHVGSGIGNQNHFVDNEGERKWIKLWVTVLHSSPGGPTLFYPRTSEDINLSNPGTIPPYLFRVFDSRSSGKNDKQVMASPGHTSQIRTSDIDDLLGMEDLDATQSLYYHIDQKWSRKNDDQDGLVSWTNSLLYAVQYATYRKHILDLPNDGIKICMVQTSRFPQGQFVRDIELLKKYLPIANELGGEVKKTFSRRLDQEEFYNGEYFSQGEVNHAGRSCVVSLGQLEDAHIFRLYPGLEDPRDHTGKVRNAIKLIDLRKEWSLQRTTTNEEISDALNIAQECFESFETIDIACMLLDFKRRVLSNKSKLITNPAPSWADKPVEVNRYWQVLEILRHLKADLGTDVEMRDIYRVTISSYRVESR